MEPCYLLMSEKEWQSFQGDVFYPEYYASEGFIHLCTKEQIEWVANQFFKEVEDLAVFELDLEVVKEKLQWATVPGVGDFPHLHAGLPRVCVKKVIKLAKSGSEDGGPLSWLGSVWEVIHILVALP